MRGVLANIQMNWRLRRYKGRVTKQPENWKAVERIAVVTRKTSDLNKSEIDAFFHNSGKYVEVFLVETTAVEASFSDWYCLTLKDCNVLGLPLKNVLRELETKHFDVLISTCAADDRFATMVTNAVPASLRCAADSGLKGIELVIATEKKAGIITFLKEVLRYMQMIRSAVPGGN